MLLQHKSAGSGQLKTIAEKKLKTEDSTCLVESTKWILMMRNQAKAVISRKSFHFPRMQNVFLRDFNMQIRILRRNLSGSLFLGRAQSNCERQAQKAQSKK